jgi:hypothetical protein
VPSGSYDRFKGAWVPSENGRIVTVVGQSDGRAEVDVDGDGLADDPAVLGIAEAERELLASRYAVGQQLWRVPIPHFSPWDFKEA